MYLPQGSSKKAISINLNATLILGILTLKIIIIIKNNTMNSSEVFPSNFHKVLLKQMCFSQYLNKHMEKYCINQLN